MNPQFLFICAALCLATAGCSTVRTQKPTVSIATLRQNDRFQLLVRTEDPVLDKLLYEMAYQEFGQILPLRDRESYTGVMEITFASSDQSAFGSSLTVGHVNAYRSAEYRPGGYTGGVTGAGAARTVSSGPVFSWQNSIMLVVLKRNDGERIWTGDCNYKGGLEFSGFSVNTAEDAARLVVRRMKAKLKADFRIR